MMAGKWLLFDTVRIPGGWSLVGGLSDPIATVNVPSEPDSIISSAFFAYGASGYYPVDTLSPGGGYWLKANGPGSLVLNNVPSSRPFKARRFGVSSATTPAKFNTLTISACQSKPTTLYFSSAPVNLHSGQYELPPVPPAGAFDARFASGRYVESMPSTAGMNELPLLIQAGSTCHTLSISANISQDNSRQFFLVEKVGNKVIEKERLENSSSLVIPQQEQATFSLRTESMPSKFKLYQNYPNPFNPTTIIAFDLPSAAVVSVSVYNVLGQRVVELASQRQFQGGTESLEFDARNLASGVYLYRVDAVSTDVTLPGHFTQTRKMLLIK
jgi:hypothetical protein